jgi:heat shock protein 5
MRNTIDDTLASKLDSNDKSTIREALDDAASWLKSNDDDGTKDYFEEKLKDVQRVCDPIIAKVY